MKKRYTVRTPSVGGSPYTGLWWDRAAAQAVADHLSQLSGKRYVVEEVLESSSKSRL